VVSSDVYKNCKNPENLRLFLFSIFRIGTEKNETTQPFCHYKSGRISFGYPKKEISFANKVRNPIGLRSEIATPPFGGLTSMGIGF